jgi:hypothetical protein
MLCCIVHPNNLLPFCIAGQIVVRAGCVQGTSEMVQPLDARIPQEVNRVTSCMVIANRDNYLSCILVNLSRLLGILLAVHWKLSNVLRESVEDGQEESVYMINSWKYSLWGVKICHVFYLFVTWWWKVIVAFLVLFCREDGQRYQRRRAGEDVSSHTILFFYEIVRRRTLTFTSNSSRATYSIPCSSRTSYSSFKITLHSLHFLLLLFFSLPLSLQCYN